MTRERWAFLDVSCDTRGDQIALFGSEGGRRMVLSIREILSIGAGLSYACRVGKLVESIKEQLYYDKYTTTAVIIEFTDALSVPMTQFTLNKEMVKALLKVGALYVAQLKLSTDNRLLVVEDKDELAKATIQSKRIEHCTKRELAKEYSDYYEKHELHKVIRNESGLDKLEVVRLCRYRETGSWRRIELTGDACGKAVIPAGKIIGYMVKNRGEQAVKITVRRINSIQCREITLQPGEGTAISKYDLIMQLIEKGVDTIINGKLTVPKSTRFASLAATRVEVEGLHFEVEPDNKELQVGVKNLDGDWKLDKLYVDAFRDYV